MVVKPETVSKKASTKLGISPERTKGTAPKSDMAIHASDTTASPSLAYRDGCLGFFAPSSSPVPASSSMGMRNGSGGSRYSAAVSRGSAISAASTSRILPRTYPIIR